MPSGAADLTGSGSMELGSGGMESSCTYVGTIKLYIYVGTKTIVNMFKKKMKCHRTLDWNLYQYGCKYYLNIIQKYLPTI